MCVDARAYPSSQDCVTQGATCTQLEEALFRARALERNGAEQAATQAAACLDEIHAARLELSCEPGPNGPFLPACEVPVDFESDCGFAETCQQLGCEECPSLGSEVEGCTFTDGTCQCSTTADCVHPDICVDAVQHPASLDCAVEDASCTALRWGEDRLQDFLDAEPAANGAAEARTCLDAIRAQQQALACSG